MTSNDLPPFDIFHGDGISRPDTGRLLPNTNMLFQESGAYLADHDLVDAVNTALAVSQPLLVAGEPGCGKTRLAWAVARELGLGEPLPFYTRSTSRAQDLLYTFDAMLRFYDTQMHDSRAKDPKNYLRYEPLGQAIVNNQRKVVLIDEIDKASRDFPNDLLTELDRMSFMVHELAGSDRVKRATLRPIVIITSNNERQLPLPFLRRCVFHYISFPSPEKLVKIIYERLGPLSLDENLVKAAVEKFQQVRDIKNLGKKPATGELLSWLVALLTKGVTTSELLISPLSRLPLWQALLKDRDDLRKLQEAC